jgi:hypothetical protein
VLPREWRWSGDAVVVSRIALTMRVLAAPNHREDGLRAEDVDVLMRAEAAVTIRNSAVDNAAPGIAGST